MRRNHRRARPSRLLDPSSALALVFVVFCSSTNGLSLLPRRTPLSRLPCRRIPQERSQSPWRIRGGGAALYDSTTTAGSTPTDDTRRRRERGMAAALFSTYFCVMGAKCALPSVLFLLREGLDFSGYSTLEPQQLMKQLLTIATLAIALGKLVLGPIIDRFGGILSLQVSLTVLMLSLARIASCTKFGTFAPCWVLVDFIFSSCWAGCINAVHQCFPQDEWAGRVGMLAVAARTGNAAAFSIFASVLRWNFKGIESWRLVFFVSAIMQILPITLLTYFGRYYKQDNAATTSTDGRPSMKASLATLRKEAATPSFWCHLMSRAALMVFGSFLLFVPTLMTNCYGATSAFGAQTGSIFALGCLLSVTLGSQRYASLNRKHKILAVICMLGTATLVSVAQWGHMCGAWHLSRHASAALLFLWGFSFAIPFYIPPSLYALSKGSTSSATIADVFDFAGFGLLAPFNGYVTGLQHNVLASWIPTFSILTTCSLVSLISLTFAVYFE